MVFNSVLAEREQFPFPEQLEHKEWIKPSECFNDFPGWQQKAHLAIQRVA